MINILIIENNAHYATTLLNYINRKTKNIRVIGIALNGQEALEMINLEQEIDFILLDLKIPIYSGEEIINKISYEKKMQLDKSIIIISGAYNENVVSLSKNKMINCILHKTIGIEEITKRLEEIIETKKENEENNLVKQKIYKELLNLGYDFAHKGTKYICYCIYTVITSRKPHLDNLKRELYPIVAEKYNETIHNIKCNITRATDKMYYSCTIDKIKEYFYYYYCKKPHIKTIIFTIANKLR